MRKLSLRVILFVLLFATSIAAQVFLNHKAALTLGDNTDTTHQGDSTEVNPVSLDVEILKVLIEHGKNHLPMISSPSSID